MLLRWLISAVGLAALKGEISAIAQRAGRRAILFGLVIVLWLTAFGFALAALAVWLSSVLGTVAAYAIIAAVFAFVGLILQVVLAVTAHRHRHSSLDLPLPGLTAPAGGGAAEGSIFGLLAIVAILGWLLGRQMTRK